VTRGSVGLRAEGGGSVWNITDPPPLLRNLFGVGWGDNEIYAYMSLHKMKSGKITVSFFQYTTGFEITKTVDGPYIQGRLDL
jgi:hypothetical protein